jgi:hypothetical protein
MAWTLCSKDDVMSLHPVTESELRDEWSEFVEGLIRQHMSSPYLGTSEVITNEYHDGDGSTVVFVGKAPIISVQSLVVNGVTLAASDYVIFPTYIQLSSMIFPEGNLNIVISYTSGSTGQDDVVRMAAAVMIVAIINFKKRFGADASVRFGNVDQKLGEDSANISVGLTDHLNAIMKRLLRRPSLRVA